MFRALVLMSTCTAALGAPSSSFAGTDQASHIRITNQRIAEMVQFAEDRSPRFRELLRAVDGSSAIVYIEEGRCMDGRLHSCVRAVAAPPARYVVIELDPREHVLAVVRALAHELEHAVEIGVAEGIDSAASIEALYRRIGFPNCPRGRTPCWETYAAQDAERQVVAEVQHGRTTTLVSAGFFGAWTLNVTQSLFDGQPPASGCRVNADRGSGLISTVIDMVDAAGTAHRDAFVFRPDGREYPVSGPGERPRRTILVTPVDELNAEFVLREDGAEVATGRWVLAANGLTLVVQTLRVDAEGHETPTVTVWAKQLASKS